MNIFELAATIKLDSSSFEKGLQKSEQSANRFTKGLSATTVAAGQIMADVARKAVSAIGDIVGGAVDQFADYEQLIGGVNKIFGESADTIINNSEQAYKTAGISANNYMQTVTSFSASLVSGLGGDTQQAAELANQAIIDMSDNANTYGTDIQSIQNAYMGFAKRNFMMLDNLKLGYGGTAMEMLRLVNDAKVLDHEVTKIEDVDFATIIKAVHVMQEQMNIAGTTAKEAATTISGSKNSMAAAWDDLLTSVASGDSATFVTKMQGFEDAFGTYLQNMLPRAIATIGGAGALAEGLSKALTENIDPQMFSEGAFSLETAITGVFSGLTNVSSWLINGLTDAFSNPNVTVTGAEDLGNAIGTFISTTISDLFTNGGSILSGVVTTAFNLGKGLFEGLFAGFFGGDDEEVRLMEEALGTIDDTMRDSMQEASDNAVKGKAITDYMQSLVDKYGDAAKNTEGWARAVEDLEKVLPGAKAIIDEHAGDINGVTDALNSAIDKEKELAFEAAQREALQGKLNALAVARGDLATAQGQLEYAQSMKGYALSQIQQNAAYSEALAYHDISEDFLDTVLNTFSDDEDSFAKSVEQWFGQYFAEGDTEGLADFTALLKAYKDSSKTIDDTSKQIEGLEKAVQMATSSYNTANAALQAWTASLRVPPTVNINDVPSWEITGSGIPGHANGLDYVPYDNYRARLHRGEAVLTSAEATEWRRGGNGNNPTAVADLIGASVERALAKAGIYMDGMRVGELTTRTVAGNIRTQNNARMRAMGG